MRLKLEELQKVVKRAVDEERATEALRVEVARVLGPAVITEGKLEQLAEAANEWMDVLERTGRSSRLDFKSSLTVRYLDHNDPQVRKFAARVVPEKFLPRMVNDRNSAVRTTVARRLPIGAVAEMLKRFPKDDAVRVVYKQKRLAEAGIKQPTIDDDHFDLYGDERMGDAARQDNETELSEQWYKTRALRLLQDYGGNIEYNWEELAVRRFASSTRATSGVEIDEGKLLKAVKDLIEEREDTALERDALKETLSWLKSKEEQELLVESTLPPFEEAVDHVRDLVESNLSASTFIEKANALFSVKESTLPPGICKHRLGELSMRSESVPVIGQLPHQMGFRAIDERALDMYCKTWNDKQQLQGEPLKLEWVTHPDRIGKISFTVVLR